MAKKDDDKLSIAVPLFASALLPITVASPLPIVDETIAGLIAAGAWLKYFGDRGVTVTGQKSNPRKNPLPVVFGVGLGTIAGVAAAGVAAVAAYKAYSAEEEREPALRAVEEDPALSLLNPAIGAAAGAAIGYATGQPVWKGTLYGFFFGIALKRLAVEVTYSRSKAK
jgi:hypothetical protein